mgnify:CR=1 FL=1
MIKGNQERRINKRTSLQLSQRRQIEECRFTIKPIYLYLRRMCPNMQHSVAAPRAP